MFWVWGSLALGIAGAAACIARRESEEAVKPRGAMWPQAATMLALALIAWTAAGANSQGALSLRGLGMGLALGAIGVVAGAWIRDRFASGLLVALGAIPLATLNNSGDYAGIPQAAGLAIGLAIAALVSQKADPLAEDGLAIGALVTAGLAGLARETDWTIGSLAPNLLLRGALPATGLALAGYGAAKVLRLPPLGIALVAGLAGAAGSYLSLSGFADVNHLPWCAAIGLVAALAAGLSLDEEGNSLRFGLGAIILLAAGTVAFTLARGPGVALVATGALVGAALSQKRVALFAVAPLAGLTLLRAYRGLWTSQGLTFELNFHHQIIALVLAVVLVLALSEVKYPTWQKALPAGLASAVLAGTLLAMAPVFFSARAPNGMILGAGLAGLLFAFKPPAPSSGYAMTALALTVPLAAYPFTAESLELSQDAKVRALVISAVLAGILALVVTMLARPSSNSRPEAPQS